MTDRSALKVVAAAMRFWRGWNKPIGTPEFLKLEADFRKACAAHAKAKKRKTKWPDGDPYSPRGNCL